jgi:EAL domain-containing protein (putative c-di-GMP-specific phosphodiesterase class I)
MSNNETEERYLVSVSGTISGWDKPQEKLGKAFAQNEFILFSQSIVKLAPGGDKAAHFEIFVRLQEEERHLIPPGSFLPMLEYFNLGPELDRYVVRKLLAWYRTAPREQRGIAHLNLCGGTLADPDFCAFVGEELKRNKIGGAALCFEFPGKETSYPASAVALAECLAKIGCRISVGAMDDENIPFRPIKDLGANFLKIGGRLIQELAGNEAVVAEVKTAAHACRSFDVQTIAQNVENAPTLNLLRKLNISFAQGYGISRPGPLGKAAKARG